MRVSIRASPRVGRHQKEPDLGLRWRTVGTQDRDLGVGAPPEEIPLDRGIGREPGEGMPRTYVSPEPGTWPRDPNARDVNPLRAAARASPNGCAPGQATAVLSRHISSSSDIPSPGCFQPRLTITDPRAAGPHENGNDCLQQMGRGLGIIFGSSLDRGQDGSRQVDSSGSKALTR